MATTLTMQNKQTLKRLLKTGRWNNESEIMRYGLHLVVTEVEAKEHEWPRPVSKQELDKIYSEETEAEKALDKAASKASAASSKRSARKLAKEGF